MKKEAIIMAVLLAIGMAGAQTVTRTLNDTTLCTGQSVLVTLNVAVGNADAYAIDETVSGWAITNAGTGSTNHTGHLKWVVIGEQGNSLYDCSGLESCLSSIQNTAYNYILTAPATPGTMIISGEYLFDIGTTQTTSSSVTVESCTASECADYMTSSSCNAAYEGCSWCAQDVTCKDDSLVVCTANECYNTTHMCVNCAFSYCGAGKQCNMATDLCENIPIACESYWDCTDWSPATCPSTGTQTRACTDTNNCATPTNQPELSHVCTPGNCESSWTCTSWSPAVCPTTGNQTRTCSDENSCATPTEQPELSRTCTPGTCQSSWTCTSWSPSTCPSTGTQTRTCTDDNSCPIPTDAQSLTRPCTYTGSSGGTSGGSSGGSGAIVPVSRAPPSSSTAATVLPGRGSTATSGRTSTTAGGTEASAPAGRTRPPGGTDETQDKTEEQVLEESASTMNMLFYIILVILVVLVGGLYYWIRHRGETPTLNSMNLTKNRQFIEQQKPKL